jgi:hypothetical protein
MQYNTFTASELMVSSRTLLKGFCIAATSTAVVKIYDGTSASGTLVMTINVDTNQTAILSVPDAGLPMNTGLYVQVTSGSVSGSVWFD